jgi:flagellar motility protein MotE (MotC chaperone)
MTAAPRLLPLVILALLALGLVKTASLFVSFSAADAAQQTPVEIVPASAPQSDAEKRLLARLAERRAALDAREAELDTRETLLEGVEERLSIRLAELEEKGEPDGTTASSGEKRAREFAALSDAYERMKPRDAAPIFEVLEDDILVPVAAGMRTQALAGVLAEMDPEKARRLTRLLAERQKAD